MAKLKTTIIDPIGIHARPATIVVRAASEFESDIKIISGGREGDMKSLMGVMALGIKNGTEITIEATGSDADAAISKIEDVMKINELI